MPTSLNRLSKEYLFFPIVTASDISTATLQVAFLPAGQLPIETDWVAAQYVNDGTIYARILVSGTGAGGTVALAPGDWQSWLRITTAAERPVRKPGVVTIE